MKGYKRFIGLYSAWDYTREIEVLNKRSDNGWQLIKGGLFSSLFKKNDDIRYRYQVDFNTKIEDMGRYIETFHEQGWEYVNSTWNGWHFFRKIYDPSVSPEEYEIYNDSESLKEMQNKWQRLGIGLSVTLVLMIILEVIMCIRTRCPRLPNLILIAGLTIEAIVLGRGIYIMRNTQRADGHKRGWNGMPAFITSLFAMLVVVTVLIFIRGGMSYSTKSEKKDAISADLAKAENWAELKLSYPDFYALSVEGKVSAPVTISVVEKSENKVVQQIRVLPSENGKPFKQIQTKYLKRGSYIIYFSDFEGGSLDMNISLD